MTIQEIAERLNDLAIEGGYSIAALPELRKRHLGKKQLPNKIFTFHTIFDGNNKYAFHHGGRDEMQFNFGQEEIDGNVFSRYGLCFSLNASHSLPNPVGDLEHFKKKFNECVDKHPQYFNDFDLWYYQNGQRHGNFSPQKISDHWFQNGTFICVGKVIRKSLAMWTEKELKDTL